MSFRKEQEAARARAAEPINLGRGKIWFNVESTPGVSPDLSRAAEDLGRRVGEDIVHRMFAEHQAQQAKGTFADESVVYRYYESAEKAADYTFSWWEDGQAHPRDYYSTRQWKAEPNPAEKFRVLPDGTIDLHPSQWSVIA